MIKAVIFDLDGVIVHTDHYHYLAWKALADKIGVYFDEKINDRLRGVSRMDSLDIILERSTQKYTNEEKVALATEKNELYKNYLKEMTPADVSVDTVNTLKALKRNGIKIAIGSSSKNAKFILKQVGLYDIFDAISDGNNITHSKPNPEVFSKAGEFVRIDPSLCLVVEDALSGIEAGKRAGMYTASIGSARAENAGDYQLDKLSDLLKII